MKICSACGHALTPDGPCGFASITVGEKTTYLCHADDHSCYMGVAVDAGKMTSGYLPLPDAAEGTGETDSHDDPGEANPASDAVRDCPFCARIRKYEYAETGDPEVVTFEPLNPVTPGHRLVIPTEHVRDAAIDSRVTGITFAAAASYADTQGEPFNLITSAGHAATQTVDHLHVHYVPRRADDGLPLPWSNQMRDLAAPSNGSVSSRPSPGAGPRVEAIAIYIGNKLGPTDRALYMWMFEEGQEILAAADAADRAADPPWIRIRCDEVTVELVARIIDASVSNPATTYTIARAVLAALAGEQ